MAAAAPDGERKHKLSGCMTCLGPFAACHSLAGVGGWEVGAEDSGLSLIQFTHTQGSGSILEGGRKNVRMRVERL